MRLEQKDLAELTARIVVAAIQSGLTPDTEAITTCYEAIYHKISDCDKALSDNRSFD